MRIPSLLAILTALALAAGAVPAFSAPADAVKRNNFGADLVRQGRLEEAVGEFQRALEADPRHAAAQLNLAFTLDRLGRSEEAIAAYQRAIELDPLNPNAYNNLGVLYDKAGQYDQAIEMLEKAVQIQPNHPAATKNLENAKRSRSTLSDREAQIAVARKQAEARPSSAEAAYQLSRVYASYSMKDQALEWLAKAIQLGYADFQGIQDDPTFGPLKNDPRLQQLLRKP